MVSGQSRMRCRGAGCRGAHRRIGGGEQLVGDVDLALGEGAEQRRFASVGIAAYGDAAQALATGAAGAAFDIQLRRARCAARRCDRAALRRSSSARLAGAFATDAAAHPVAELLRLAQARGEILRRTSSTCSSWRLRSVAVEDLKDQRRAVEHRVRPTAFCTLRDCEGETRDRAERWWARRWP